MTFLLLTAFLTVVGTFLYARHRGRHSASGVSGSGSAIAEGASGDQGERADAWEGTFWEVEAPLPVRADLLLDYTDGNGSRTSRRVEVRQFGGFGPTCLLIGHCHLRNAIRTFRVDRIHACTDLETGEVLNDLLGTLTGRFHASPEGAVHRLRASELDLLRVFLFVAKADGQMRANERALIAQACRQLSGDTRITDDIVKDLLTTFDVPSLAAFRLAVGRVAALPLERRALVRETAHAIVATQRKVHGGEADALEYLDRRLADSAVNSRDDG